MAQYGAMMHQQPWGSSTHTMNRPQNGPQIAHGSQDPKRPQQPPVMHVVGDVKPRLTKEQHDILEAHFQQQAKPTTNTKKGFAESLGVPLDKINNWFQNRRAKVKQDYKKQMNALSLYQQQLAMAQMNNQPPPPNPEFYGVNAPLDPSVFHPNATRAAIDNHNPCYSMPPQHAQAMGMLGAIPESHNTVTTGEIMNNLVASGYSLDGFGMANNAAKSAIVAYDGSHDFIFDQNYNMTNVQDFGAQFGEAPGNGDGFDFQNFLPGVPMQATHSNGSTPSIPSTLSSVQTTSTMASSVGTTPMPAYGSSEWPEEKPTISFSQGQNLPQNAYSSPPEDVTSMWTQTQHQQRPDHGLQSEEVPRPGSANNFPPTPPINADQQVGELDPSIVLPPEAFSRRTSSTIGLAESMGNVEIQQRSASLDAAFKQPTTPGSLAVRRRGPRPADLGEASLRSASYSSGMSVSPGASASLAAPDHNLRRIRSSNIAGIQNGRVQKNGDCSRQRSPMNMTFAEAAASPKFAHQASQIASIASPSSLAPPTPLTPNEGARFPSWQSHHSVNTSVDHGSPNGIAVSWTSESPALFPHTVSSPPETPLDIEQTAQYQAYLHDASMYRDTPPQSAPANQQSFSVPFAHPVRQMTDSLSVNPAHMAHIRRSSFPENANVTFSQQVPALNAPTGDMPLTYHSMPYSQPQFAHPQPQATLPSQTTSAFPTPPQAATAPVTMQQSNLLSADFAVHEYTPPSAQGRASDSASPSNGLREQSTPKVYHFANQGPRDFGG